MDYMVGRECELVKYMSKLPAYLETGENHQEKVLSVGVLDWRRLEKWRHGQKQIHQNNTSPSASDTKFPSSLPIDDSSAYSSKGQTGPFASQRTRRKSLQFHLMSGPLEEGFQVAKSSGEDDRKFRNRKTTKKKVFKDKEIFIGQDTDSSKIPSAISSKIRQKKDSDFNLVPERRTINGVNCEVVQGIKVKLKSQNDELMKRGEKVEKRNLDHHVQEVGRKQPGLSKISISMMSAVQREAQISRNSLTERPREGCNGEADGCRHLRVKSEINSITMDGNKFSSEISSSASRLTKQDTSPSRFKSVEDKRSVSISAKPGADQPSQGQDLKSNKLASDKGRSISPFRRRSFSMSMTNKISSDGPDCSKPMAKDRARSSPLRRLLERLVKPKAAYSSNFPGDSMSQQDKRLSSDGEPYPPVIQSEKTKSVMTRRKTVDANDSAPERNHGSSTVQALLRVTVKNNRPLFTFAVDNESEILAATVKKFGTSKEDDYTGIYTFFSIQEVKKKNGMRINQKCKGQPHDIISNAVAQMRVSSASPSGSIREFVLFSVDLARADQENSDLQLNNELAAIVIKIPNRIYSSSVRNADLFDEHRDSADTWFDNYSENENYSVPCGWDVSATVILPSGVHSLPHKGGPSSLIQRWISGGSCDCGGWDIGCNLRVLADHYQLSKNSTSSNTAPAISGQFDLFSLEGQRDDQPLFSFVPLKDGIYSVEYNSSLSSLQAFSICIAAAESKKLSELSESEIPHEGRYVSYPPLSPVGRV